MKNNDFLRLFRNSLRKTAVDMAKEFEVSSAQYGNWERGVNPLPQVVKEWFLKNYGIDLDCFKYEEVLYPLVPIEVRNAAQFMVEFAIDKIKQQMGVN